MPLIIHIKSQKKHDQIGHQRIGWVMNKAGDKAIGFYITFKETKASTTKEIPADPQLGHLKKMHRLLDEVGIPSQHLKIENLLGSPVFVLDNALFLMQDLDKTETDSPDNIPLLTYLTQRELSDVVATPVIHEEKTVCSEAKKITPTHTTKELQELKKQFHLITQQFSQPVWLQYQKSEEAKIISTPAAMTREQIITLFDVEYNSGAIKNFFTQLEAEFKFKINNNLRNAILNIIYTVALNNNNFPHTLVDSFITILLNHLKNIVNRKFFINMRDQPSYDSFYTAMHTAANEWGDMIIHHKKNNLKSLSSKETDSKLSLNNEIVLQKAGVNWQNKISRLPAMLEQKSFNEEISVSAARPRINSVPSCSRLLFCNNIGARSAKLVPEKKALITDENDISVKDIKLR